ncbi:MAG: tetratricopeptide repeat protein [Candidatus Bipolaricaulota bacterium]
MSDRSSLTYDEKESRVHQAIENAQNYREEGQYKRGTELLLDTLEFGILRDKIYYRLGNIYFDWGKLDKAEYAYKKCIELNEEHANAQHNLAVVYRRQGNIGKSVKQRKKAQKVEIKNPPERELSDEEREKLKGIAWKTLGLIFLGLVGIAGLGYLVFILV